MNSKKDGVRKAREFVKQAILLIPRLVQLLYRLLRDSRVSRTNKLMLGALIAYVASPIDIVPDFIPIAGQADDLLAIAIAVARLIAESGEDVIQENWSGPQKIGPWIRKVAFYSEAILPNRVVRAIFQRFGGRSAL